MERNAGGIRGKTRWVTALVANRSGEIFELDGYVAVGMAGGDRTPLSMANTVPMPHGGELMYLPNRHPLLYNHRTDTLEVVAENPFAPGEPLFPVAAFNSPGYVQRYLSAFIESKPEDVLPLFSYGAVGWADGGFRTSVIQVDDEPRQDLRLMPMDRVRTGVTHMRRMLPDNRLCRHLERCALEYGCPAGKNFFLGRYEAPLPTSRSCNARCLGCLSHQEEPAIPCSQDRIAFTPSPSEIAAVALAHIGRVRESVVSFGQGCEGDPLLAADAIEPAIRQIRAATSDGTIHINTNGSLPDVLARLFDAGLDSIRVSLNSVRPACYRAYFRPNGYDFDDVLAAIDLARTRKRFVAVNYLNCPGFTDTPEEAEALRAFLSDHPVDMIQWRNLNFDPVHYWRIMGAAAPQGRPMGMDRLLARVRKDFPDLRHGYFNPPKESWKRETKDGMATG
jgi:pyruvate-formate lyase-activating enzyme